MDKEYKVTIKEMISETFNIVAKSAEEAYLILKQMQVFDNSQDYIDWKEF